MNLSEFNKIITKYQNSYGKQITELKKHYINNIDKISTNEFKNICQKYRNIIKKMIFNLSKDFLKNYQTINVVIALTGSFARGTNTLYSDIDLNFLTDGNDFKEVIEIEDKINYILQKVIGFRGRDKIHSMVVYLPLISNVKYDFILKNKYPLKFKDATIYFNCRNNAEKLMFKNYNSTRNIYKVIDYFNEYDNKYKLYDWTNCFEVVYEQGFKDIYKQKRKVCKDHSNLIIHLEQLLSNLKDDYNTIQIDNVENSKIKSTYKSDVLFNVYKMLAIFYRFEKELSDFNIEEFQRKSKYLTDNFFDKFYRYLKNIQDLQVIFDINNCDLTSHSDEIINIEKINSIYKKLTKKDSIINILNESKKELYQQCIVELNKLKDDLR